MKKILVPLDGSELAEKILPPVEKLVKSTEAEVHLLQVVSPPSLGIGEVRSVPREPAAVESGKYVKKVIEQEKAQEERIKAEAEEYLEKVAARLRKKGIQAHPIVVLGKDAVQICDLAQARHFDMIAMATHGRSGLTRWALGSVTDKVLQCSAVPVLVFRVS